MTLVPGSTIGRYDIIDLLGAGGMGEVYRARDRRLAREVAIKVLPEHLRENPRAMAHFEREARALAALSHPSILAIYDIGSGPPAYVVTELLEGETLRARLSRGATGWQPAVEIGATLADGLAAAHAKDIVHRDLKPENVFLASDGRVKILDFGLAQQLHPPSADAATKTDTELGALIGTPGYMSPEQLRGERAGPASDIFSFGCVLYEMIAGRHPFAAATSVERIASTLGAEAPRLSGIPAELIRLLSHCLEKRPRDRFESARDLAFALKAVIAPDDGERTATIDSIAVLPFSTSTATPDAEYLSDGITESLINGLAQLPRLRVIARSTVYRHRGEDPLQVGRELGVHAVVTGRVFHRGDVLTIGVELAEVASGSQMWGQQYRRQMADIFDIQEDISREISQKLRLKLSGDEQERLTRRYTDDREAYQAYLRGRYCWNQRTITGMTKAVDHFRQAIERDPAYALAYTGLGDAMAMLGIYQHVKAAEAFPKAKAAARRALDIDGDLAEAHATLGFSALYFDWDRAEAERELKKAIRLSPGYASAHQWYGMWLSHAGQREEGMREWAIAQELDPFSASINTTSAWPYFWARRTEEAVQRLRVAVELHPGFWLAHYYLGLAHAQQEDFEAAIAALHVACDLSDSSWVWEGIGHTLAMAGRTDDAEATLARLREITARQYVSPYSHAVILGALRRIDDAFDWLEKGIEERAWRMAWLRVDPLLDPLRADPRFDALLARLLGPAARP